MIALERVSKAHDGTPALSDVTLDVQAGRTTVLIGPSGCGKSTLLRLVVGLASPDAGSVRVDGVEPAGEALGAVRRRMGYVIQEGGLFPHLTALGNVALLARHLGWDEPRVQARAAELGELTRLPDGVLDRYPSQLSGGQRQRVALVRALFLDPDVLLLDEPLGALDPLIRADLQEDLARIFSGLGKTVLLVTHDLAEATFFGDEIVLLRAGRIVQAGAPDDLLHRPAEPFVTRFVRAQRGLHGDA